MLLAPLVAILAALPALGARPDHAKVAERANVERASTTAKSCTYTITSYDNVAAGVASACNKLYLNSFTVPKGKALDLSGLATGTTVTMNGDITFASGTYWVGPLFIIKGTNINFNGNGKTFNGNGQDYWDTKGGNGGVKKPKMAKISNGGTFANVRFLNTPVHAISVGNTIPLTISNVEIDNRAGDVLSGGNELAHNTDCFDVSATHTLITNSRCYNQDDCLAINKGTNITFSNNYCSGGHGISIGSVASGSIVKDIRIVSNAVVDSTNAFRIKTIYGATGGSVSNVEYKGNAAKGITKVGMTIQQDYENGSPTGTATNGMTISGVKFTGTNKVTMNGSKSKEVYVLVGTKASNFDFTGLCFSGNGLDGSVSGISSIKGFTLGKNNC